MRHLFTATYASSLDYFVSSDVCSCACVRRKACGLRMTVGSPVCHIPVLSHAACGSEDDEEEIASPPFEPLNTTHSSPLSGDVISSLIRYLEESRLSADNRRIQDEEDRCQPDEERRLRDNEARRKEEDSRFQVLVTLLSPPQSAASERHIPSSPASHEAGARGLSPTVAAPATTTAPLAASPVAATPTVTTSAGKHVAHSPPTLLADSSFQVFRQWRRLWEDFSTMLDLQRLPCISNSSSCGWLGLRYLQSHFKSQQNEALRRRELLCSKQAGGELFSDFFVRLKNLAEEVDLCTGNAMTCVEIQLKMVLLMGVRDEELIQCLISLDTGASLQDLVTFLPFLRSHPPYSLRYILVSKPASRHVYLQERQAPRQDASFTSTATFRSACEDST
ncbi:hypothetical protein GWK47_051498 [Chionoecetes opilio]|uniref:Uncharacterized protein n=1 Tax=Chionoecetes opilio TaxID=41210 RepID=A0A8J5CS04_CHIOP|nr:hypothetical protein GWK47_051498 [Chionoecetes opilio]